jgi:uncharacterized membrane protein
MTTTQTKAATVAENTNRPVRAERPRRRYGTDRMKALSDGVFAFAITLLVLDLVAPSGSGLDLVAAVLALWPHYLAYVVSFATIGAIWLAHTAITDRLDHADSTFMRLNLLPLLFVAFLPFPTGFLAEYVNSEQPERIAILLYGGAVVLLILALTAVRSYASREGLMTGAADASDLNLDRRLLIGLVGYLVLIGIGMIFPITGVFGFLVLAIFIIVPLRVRRA